MNFHAKNCQNSTFSKIVDSVLFGAKIQITQVNLTFQYSQKSLFLAQKFKFRILNFSENLIFGHNFRFSNSVYKLTLRKSMELQGTPSNSKELQQNQWLEMVVFLEYFSEVG